MLCGTMVLLVQVQTTVLQQCSCLLGTKGQKATQNKNKRKTCADMHLCMYDKTCSITQNQIVEQGCIQAPQSFVCLYCSLSVPRQRLFPGLRCPPLCQTIICRCHSPSDHIFTVFRERQDACTHTYTCNTR